ncbi:MAG: hypothetical protein SFX73_11900 [Kofleriaceae bacterium]|nr:hypothetical protein [Kofleriaceae bacterium]
MQLKNLASFALVAGLAVSATGCVVRAHGYVRAPAPVAVVEIEEEPPPPRVIVTDVRPGFVFIQGRWHRQGNRWVWREGRWERERPGSVWENGRWERRGRGHVWVEGRWRGGGRVEPRGNNGNVRDHRRNDPPPRDDGPVIRDHRR